MALEVLHVMPSLAHGGAEQNLLTFLRQLPKDRYRNHLAWLGGDETLRAAFEPHVETILPLDGDGRAGQLRAVASLARWIRERRPDVIHAQMVAAQLVARLAALLARRTPVVTTWQCVIYHDVHDFGGSKLIRETMRLADRFTGAVADRKFIAVSEYVASQCARDLSVPRNRIEVIYNALDPERIRVIDEDVLWRTRKGLGVADDALLALSVARLHPQKGHRHLLDAMPLVLARVPNVVLLVAGRGPLREELEAQATRLGIRDNVRFLGARNDVTALYQLADLFAFPSYYEGLSVALVEALANGLPAVISDIPQNREVANGLPSVRFVPTADGEAIANAMIELLSAHAALRAIARDEQVGIRSRFAPDLLAARFGRALESAAGIEAR